MAVVLRILLDLLETIFAVGCVGSAVVLLLTSIEDARTVLEADAPPEEVTQS